VVIAVVGVIDSVVMMTGAGHGCHCKMSARRPRTRN
jgi:hypothetical protein